MTESIEYLKPPVLAIAIVAISVLSLITVSAFKRLRMKKRGEKLTTDSFFLMGRNATVKLLNA